ncbi:hypothetical protein SUGI_0292990 [Cryptomeria japonica]|nr:hypothetical protein SUGI_0292990 [Cryptomeria japonica]
MAKKMEILGMLMVLTLSFMNPAKGLIPYRGNYGDLWDAMVDPLKVLDQLPQFISKGVDDFALARTNWKETPQAHVFIPFNRMKKEEIKIQVEENRVITISGERVKEEEKEGDKWHRVERGVGKFWRQFRLPGNVDMDSIKASLDNGVLTVTVPKLSEIKDKSNRIVDIVETADAKAVA